MGTTTTIALYHSPQTRSVAILHLLEELRAPYELRALNMKKGEQREPAYLAINPMGKVPAIVHGDVLVTEQAAICIYLADLFPQAGITPALTDPLRGPYLRWLVFYGACLEPAAVDRALKREPGPPGMVPYGDYDTTVATVVAQLSRGPWLCGEKFTAADALWGTALTWLTGFGLIEAVPVIRRYVDRWNERPSVERVAAIDAQLMAAQSAG